MPSPQLERLHRDVIVVGASAGGIEALQRVVAGFPADLEAAVLVVLHMPPTGGSTLAHILSRAGPLPAHIAEDGEALAPGQIYVAGGDCHLLVGDKVVRVRKGPRENGHRPAVDPLFRSAAFHLGPRAIGVVLSGSLNDGTAGLYAIKRTGGLAVVQDPDDALYSGMPSNALEFVKADHVAKASEIGPLLVELLEEEVKPVRAAPERQLELEVELEVAYEELQSANEELETTNEELQSTIEELETTNEELQSTNEELETMNEELSSTNEELQATNDELRDRTAEVNQVNAYVESVLATLEASVIVLDTDLQVRVWNGLSFEMWGLRAEEVEGRNFLGLDLGFPVESLAPAIRACLAAEDAGEPITLTALTRRGHQIRCVGRVAPLRGANGAVEGAIVLISEEGPAR